MRELTHILCVDDDRDIRTIAVLALELDPAMRVSAAGSGAEALATLEREPLPDIVLLDVMMPEMSGVQVLTEIQKRPELSGLPVVFMTARGRQAEVEHFRSLGAAGVIIKPFDPLTLAHAVRSIINNERDGI
jgi:CheY-like chemotaxis protein